MRIPWVFFPAADDKPDRPLAGHLVDVVVLARVLGHLQSDLLPPAGLGDGLAVDLHGHDALAEVAGVAEDADGVADAQAARFNAYRRDGKMAEVVGHHPHPLLAGKR